MMPFHLESFCDKSQAQQINHWEIVCIVKNKNKSRIPFDGLKKKHREVKISMQ